jgi:uncharacterized membrane protein
MAQRPNIWDNPAFRYQAIIFGAALIVLACQFIHPGYYHNPDDDAAIMPKYVPQIVESFRQGIIYPRWMPEDFGGYGSPFFVFYNPLLYMLAALLNLAGLDVLTAKMLLELLRLYVGGTFLFLLVRQSHGERAGILSAMSYIFLPTRILDLYFYTSPASRFGQAFIPMVLLFTRRYVRSPFNRKDLALMGMSYACLVLSHLVTAYIFAPFVFAYGIVAANGKPGLKTALKPAIGILAGLGLASAFFLPVLMERGQIQMELIGRFLYSEAFLLDPFHSPAKEGLGQLQIMIRDIVLGEALLLALFYYIGRRYAGLRPGREGTFFMGSVLFCLLMMSSASAPLWRYAPGLKTIMYPARFEPVNLMFLSALMGITVSAFFGWPGRGRAMTVFASALLVGVLVFDAALIARLSIYRRTDVSGLVHRVDFPEYLPRAVDARMVDSLGGKDPLVYSGDMSSVKILKWGYVDRAFTVESARGAALRIKTFYFPGWRAWVDGEEAQVRVEEKTGAILLDVPEGRHTISLKFTDTLPMTSGAALSLITFAALVFPYRRIARWYPRPR